MARVPRYQLWLGLSIGVLCAGAFGVVRWRTAHGGQRVARAASSPVPSVRARTAFAVSELIFDGGFRPSWKAQRGPHELADKQPARVNFSSFGGLVLQHPQLTEAFGALVFRVKAPQSFHHFLQVSLRLERPDETTFPRVMVSEREIAALEDGWSEVLVPFRALNPSGVPFSQVVIEARRLVAQDWVLLDKIALTRPNASGPQLARTPRKPALVKLDCAGGASAISPLIYGIAQGIVASGETAHRIGGNAMTRLNWDLGNVWNTGSDWFFENVKGDDAGLPFWLQQAQAQGIQMALTVPTIGWVAKDSSSSGFPRAKFGGQRKHDSFRPEAGDGFSPSGKPLQPGPASQTSEAAPPERIGRWVEAIRRRDQESGKRSVHMYMLDNEPDLWNHTHRDVHPEPLSYDELLDRTIRYGTAVRKADPEALIAGPASWGWTGYFFSAKDTQAGALLQPDRRAHGGVALLPWYLQKLAEHERQTGNRILDVLDVHYYPQAEGVYGPNGGTDAATAALRIRSTRSLWDPTYKDESWINDSVQLLPRLRDWVAKNYPGRDIALGEWSFGAEHHISGALATAEALGRFGQLGLKAAYYWAKPASGTPTFWAFRAYRNYDGQGAHFLDLSLKTASPTQLSAFASRDEAASRFVLVLLNLDPTFTTDLSFDTSSCGSIARGRSFSYASGQEGITLDVATPGAGPSKLAAAPYSIKIVEFARQP